MRSAVNFVSNLVFLASFSGCGLSDVSVTEEEVTVLPEVSIEVNVESDFAPPVGRSDDPPPSSAGERRILLAYSDDGVHFTSEGEILSDQANVPDMIVEEDGTIRVYYIGQGIEDSKETTAMAMSKDNGTTWTFHLLTFEDFPQPRDPSDPDVVLLDDGTYRMYYTSSLKDASGKNIDRIGILYADSEDGITFIYGGEALRNRDDLDAADSTTMYFDGLWHMFTLQEKVLGQIHATSTDGLSFTLLDQPMVYMPEDRYIISNPLIEGDTLRMFGFTLADKNIRSFTTTDMMNWVSDDIALDGDEAATLGTNYIQDSTVAKLADGRYLMVYVSEISLEN